MPGHPRDFLARRLQRPANPSLRDPYSQIDMRKMPGQTAVLRLRGREQRAVGNLGGHLAARALTVLGLVEIRVTQGVKVSAQEVRLVSG